jgi:hypothetical protein
LVLDFLHVHLLSGKVGFIAGAVSSHQE